MTLPQPGQTWQDLHPSGADPDWLETHRRIVNIDAVEEHGFVEGVGRWQLLRDGSWRDTAWGRRKTRIRTNLFVRRYTVLEDGS